MLRVSVNGIRELQKAMGAETKAQKKALATAIKVEGFRQLRKLREDIREGRPGGHAYLAELSKIAGRTKSGRLRKNQVPLYKLARLIRYNVAYYQGQIQFDFGFVTSGNRKLSSTYKQLLIKHQEGIHVLYAGWGRTELGIHFAQIGGKLKKKGDPDAKYFFLRKTTGRSIMLPRRSMVPAYWKVHSAEAGRNIANNFRRKMRGERI